MNLEEIAKRYVLVAAEWPGGAVVWRKADGARGVIIEHILMCDGGIRIGVAMGSNTDRCLVCELSAVPVKVDEEGEGWEEAE